VAFCEIFGINVPARKNSWPGQPQFVGDELGRGAAGVLEDQFVRRVREWSGVKMVFQEPETGHALRRLLEGEYIHFDFDADMLARSGEGPASGGGYTRSNTGGKHGGKVAVSSGSFLAFDLARALGVEDGWDPTQGWTLICWKQLTTADDGVGGTGTYYLHIATGDVAVTQGASANPAGVTQYRDGVAGSYSMGNWIDVTADGVVRLHGKDNDASNNAKDYDDLVVLPFKLPTARAATWAAQLSAWMDEYAFGDAPFVKLSGDCIPDLLPLDVHVTVTSEQSVNATLAGVHYNNCLELELVVREADPLTAREPPSPLALPVQPEAYYPLGTEEEIGGASDTYIENYWGSAGIYTPGNPNGGTNFSGQPGSTPIKAFESDPDFGGFWRVVSEGTYNGTTIKDTLWSDEFHLTKCRAHLPRTGDLSFFVHFRIEAGARTPYGEFRVFWNFHLPTFTGSEFSGWRVSILPAGIYASVGLYDDGLATGGVTASASATINDEEWHTCGVVFDRTANEMRLYLDGVRVATADISALSGDDIGAGMSSYGHGTFGGWSDFSVPYGEINQVTGGDFREAMFWQSAITDANMAALHTLFEEGVPLRTALELT
jgi:hypothetical protein